MANCVYCGKDISGEASIEVWQGEEGVEVAVRAVGRDVCRECLLGELSVRLRSLLYYVDPVDYS